VSSANLVFKLVSLRGPTKGLTIEPSSDVPGGAVEKLLADIEVDPAAPSAEAIRLLGDVHALSERELSALPLAKVADLLRAAGGLDLPKVEALRVSPAGGEEMTLADFAATPQFEQSYRRLTDSWLALRLREPGNAGLARHAELIRAAHLCLVLRRSPETLRPPGAVARQLAARIVTPRAWLPAKRREAALRASYVERLKGRKPPSPSDRADRIAEKKRAQIKLTKQIRLREAILSKAVKAHARWRQDRIRDTLPSAPPRLLDGLTARRSTYLSGSDVAPAAPRIAAAPQLDDAFYASLSGALTGDEKREFDASFTVRPGLFGDLADGLDIRDIVVAANDACASIKVWEDEQKSAPPTPDPRQPGRDRPSVRAVGWGDLIVARERLVGYDAREIAHVENVLSGEERVREHERTNTTEQLTETETIERTETEKDLQTTDRYELQGETQRTIDQEYAVRAGLNTSGRYGLTKIETSLDANFQRSDSESRSSSVQLAKDVVSRAVERTYESVRELRRVTVTEKVRELNIHTIKNLPGPQATENPPSLSGVYLWVEKIHEIELRQYGTRLMIEFHIPEPAVSLLGLGERRTADIRKPAALAVGPADVNHGNYLCLARLYGAQDVEPPPATFVQVGFAWASTPEEEADEDTAEESVREMISIPAGYRPVSGVVKVSALRQDAKYIDLYVAIGGQTVVQCEGQHFAESAFTFDPHIDWPDGVPFSLRAHGHFDKTMVVQAALECERTPEALANWQLRTWERLRAAHQVMMRDYERAVDQARMDQPMSFLDPRARPEADALQTEMEELRKWSIKAMRVDPFDFDAVVQVGDYAEVDPLDADFQAPIVRFFEDAFEWRQMSYFLYPYYWGRRSAWTQRQLIAHPDPRHEAFLRAGAARVVVPVTPGYEARVLYYLDSDPARDEFDRILAPLPEDGPPPDSSFDDLWLELLTNRRDDLVLGSGTLAVQSGDALVSINDDSNWTTTDRDVGREIHIGGEQYQIAELVSGDDRKFRLNRAYEGAADPKARYATGSVPYGPPFLARIPTTLVVIAEERGKLPQPA
jgi:hypothetical protein